MKDKEEFFNILSGIDGSEFSEYSQLVGDFDFSRFFLKIGQVDLEGGGGPGLFMIRLPHSVAGFPSELFITPVRRTALEDLLTRQVAQEIAKLARYDEEGVSRRRISVAQPGQKILPRSSIVVAEEFVELRLYVTLPSRDGMILGETAKEIFFDDLPQVVCNALIYCNLDETDTREFVELMEDADQIRQVLPTRGWVAFVGEGSLLHRIDRTDLPDYDKADPLVIPESLLTEVEVPNLGSVRGLGIPAGITVILGDAYSGRVELTDALAAGIYNHVPGDGRELVVTVPDAVHVAADPGRSVQRVNIDAFVQNAGSTGPLSSDDTDGYAAQAAAVVEALEIGARALILDESSSAAGFLGQDSRLNTLFSEGVNAATPLTAQARHLVEELGVSLVVGGLSSTAEFIPVADTVLRIEGLKVEDITEEAKAVAITPASPVRPADFSALTESSRWVVPSSIDPSAGRHDVHVEAPNVHRLEFGRSSVDLSAVTQLADAFQTATIGLILSYAKLRYMSESRPIREILDLVDRDLSTEGLECLTRDLRGDLARPRRYEIAAALNRLATLRITAPTE